MTDDQPKRTFERPSEQPGHWRVIEDKPDGSSKTWLLNDSVVYADPVAQLEMLRAQAPSEATRAGSLT